MWPMRLKTASWRVQLSPPSPEAGACAATSSALPSASSAYSDATLSNRACNSSLSPTPEAAGAGLGAGAGAAAAAGLAAAAMLSNSASRSSESLLAVMILSASPLNHLVENLVQLFRQRTSSEGLDDVTAGTRLGGSDNVLLLGL